MIVQVRTTPHGTAFAKLVDENPFARLAGGRFGASPSHARQGTLAAISFE
jgi:hypothetical protein